MKTIKIRTLLIAAIVSFCCAFTCMAFAPNGVKATDGSYFKMEDAAYFRAADDGNGIRFRAQFSDDVKTAIESADEYGFLVFPQQFLTDDEGNEIKDDYINKVSKYQKVVSNKAIYNVNGVNYLNCAIKDILEENRDLGFTAVCYYKNGDAYTYASLEHDFSRSLTYLLSKGYLNIDGDNKAEYRSNISSTYNWFPNYNYPVQISSAEELASVSAEVKGGNTFEGVNFKLTDDIALGNDYEAIASTFKGYIDANEKTVTSKYGVEIAESSGTVTNLGARKSTPESSNSATAQWMTENNVSQYGVKTVGADNTFVMYKSEMSIGRTCPVKHGNPYIAFNGDYGAGTFVSLDFVGKAMPYVSFFNKKVTDSMIDGEEGILFVNGVTGLNSSGTQTSSIQTNYSVFAPNKASSGNYWSSTDRITLEGASPESLFSANKLTDNTNYRLVLGITNCATGTGAYAQFTVNAMLINVDTNSYVHKIVKDCNLNFTDNPCVFDEDYFGGSIVIYGSTFGETTVKINSVDEKGSFGLYALQNLEVEDSTAEWISKNSVKYYNAESIATDGTITLKQNQYTHIGRKNTDVPYLAIDKDINFIGTAVSIDFTGKNMPFIGLAQGNLTSSWTNGTKGMLLVNGFPDYNSSADSESGKLTENVFVCGSNNLSANGDFWSTKINDVTTAVRYGDNSSAGLNVSSAGISGLEENQKYRLVICVYDHIKDGNGYQLYYRLYKVNNDGTVTNENAVYWSNVKLSAITGAENADYYTGKLVFFSATKYAAQFKINGVYTGIQSTNDINNILYDNQDGLSSSVKNDFFGLAA